jgi:hypothetical protein
MQYATVEDITRLWRPLSLEETNRAEGLLPIVCARLRSEAKNVGKDLDAMIANDENLVYVAKQVTVDIVARALMTSTNSEPMTQFSQSAMGYTVSGTYLVAGGGLFIKKSELASLGLKRQRVGGIDFAP